ncbi:hypothetical protein [Massilia sp.]|uniref:hypothetical protein n=1 Tax=Massilia sp. TaxID=1882437 RepID=UPI00289D62C2|nr:hypothetical protein [Massilia sp.]
MIVDERLQNLLTDLFELLQASGAEQGSIVLLDGPATPRHIRYVDLLQPVEHIDAVVLPDAVIEAGGSPVMYVVRHDRLGDAGLDANRRLAQLIRVLACRADARFLAVVRPGALDVYPVTLPGR